MGTEKLSLAILKKWIGSIAWRLFLWANNTTEEDYWREITLQELEYNRDLPSITEQPCQCLRCGWIGTVWDCEGDEEDIDGDGNLGCPECLGVVDIYDEKKGNWKDVLENNLLWKSE